MSEDQHITTGNDNLAEVVSDMADRTTDQHVISKHLQRQALKDIVMPPFKIGESLRIWLIEFQQQAEYADVVDMNECCRITGRVMPKQIQNWIATVPVNIKRSWPLFTQALTLQFGRSIEAETLDIKNRLKELQQRKNETIQLHSAKWQHLVSLLPSDTFDEATKCLMYIRSLQDNGLRSLLASSPSAQLSDLITRSIEITNRSGAEMEIHINSAITTPTTNDNVNSDVQPMDIDFVGKRHRKNNKYHKNRQPSQYKPAQHTRNNNKSGPPRLYDRNGNPVCGYCEQSHRNIDCEKHNKKEVNACDTTNSTDLVDLERPTVHQVSSITATKPFVNLVRLSNVTTPTSRMTIDSLSVWVLWDTGSAINCMSFDVAEQLGLSIDRSQKIEYIDVNQNSQLSHGLTHIDILNDKRVPFHIINSLSKQVIIGYEQKIQWQAVINVPKSAVAISIGSTNYAIMFQQERAFPVSSAPKQVNEISVAAEVTKLLDQYKNVIAVNNNQPTITDLMEFEIDTGDHEPIYTPPQQHHPAIQAQIDAKFKELEENGIVTRVTHTEWGSPVTAVQKPDKSLRVCGNYINSTRLLSRLSILLSIYILLYSLWVRQPFFQKSI